MGSSQRDDTQMDGDSQTSPETSSQQGLAALRARVRRCVLGFLALQLEKLHKKCLKLLDKRDQDSKSVDKAKGNATVTYLVRCIRCDRWFKPSEIGKQFPLGGLCKKCHQQVVNEPLRENHDIHKT